MHLIATLPQAALERWLIAMSVTIAAALTFTSPLGAAEGAATAEAIRPFVVAKCADCHGEYLAEAKLDLESLPLPRDDFDRAEIWQEVVDRLTVGDMPPPGAGQPPEEDKLAVIEALRGELAHVRAARKSSEVVMRRLNREEYNNTMRDLTGLDLRLGDRFPSEIAVDGFDNIGEALAVSPYLMELYLDTAGEWLDAAILTERPETVDLKIYGYRGGMGDIDPDKYRRPLTFAELSPEKQTQTRATPQTGSGFRNGKIAEYVAKFEWHYLDVPRDGRYRFRVLLSGRRSTAEQPLPRIRFVAGSGSVAHLTLPCPVGELSEPEWYEFEARLPAGIYNFRGEYLNPEPAAVRRERKQRIENYEPTFFQVHWVEARGPLHESWPPESTRRLLPPERIDRRDEVASARRVLKRFLHRAWRRPATDAEVADLLDLFREVRPGCDSFEEAIQTPLATALSSPHFLYLVEPAADRQTNGLSDYELASRLSYFLWSSMPDEELLTLAAKGRLRKPAVLTSQLDRMLADPKSAAFVDNFVGQWLRLRDLRSVQPDPAKFPHYNDWLEESMRRETRSFFREVVEHDLSVLNFIDSEFATLNDELARHYGIPGVDGAEFRRVPLPSESLRGGLLTQASVLTLTADGRETSPIHRGKWILESFLNTPPPPPPPDVPELEEAERKSERPLRTVREKLAAHREQAACAGCHAKMDPLGFALESFDPVGVFREYHDAARTIPTEPYGELPDGSTFDGPEQFKQVLLERRREVFLRGLTTKLLTFALGRPVGFADRDEVDHIVRRVTAADFRMRTLLKEIATSEAFRSL